jgi:hypothetical protein
MESFYVSFSFCFGSSRLSKSLDYGAVAAIVHHRSKLTSRPNAVLGGLEVQNVLGHVLDEITLRRSYLIVVCVPFWGTFWN